MQLYLLKNFANFLRKLTRISTLIKLQSVGKQNPTPRTGEILLLRKIFFTN